MAADSDFAETVGDLEELEGRALRLVELRRAALDRMKQTRRKMRELGQKINEQEAVLCGDATHDCRDQNICQNIVDGQPRSACVEVLGAHTQAWLSEVPRVGAARIGSTRVMGVAQAVACHVCVEPIARGQQQLLHALPWPRLTTASMQQVERPDSHQPGFHALTSRSAALACTSASRRAEIMSFELGAPSHVLAKLALK
eukprot:CAMPEP_0203960178 /NCGR_PEP_ID=MMETSP0359-20131031/90948_1 /ASSEMBLY_ACC=CAM_ASM_000338 /TAXON_ID=268821 /ORGANISM="Scrippsiella Hangoei, Strain SHTV-5" /LENGTH=199 /DNA_ID=CAMNT_0050894409 /DNA_START=68 /DNA_END=666 /DNA_ORIENTATION=+